MGEGGIGEGGRGRDGGGMHLRKGGNRVEDSSDSCSRPNSARSRQLAVTAVTTAADTGSKVPKLPSIHNTSRPPKSGMVLELFNYVHIS